jgi:hypothetical protein
MVLASLVFIFNRCLELITLIPTLGMLAFFVNGYASNNQLTPYYILCLFIVSTLAAVWALVTVLRLGSTKRSGIFVSFVDLCFIGAFIAGVYDLRGIANADCTNVYGGFSSSGGVSTGPNSVTISPLTIDYQPFGVSTNLTCGMLKACFAFGIMNCLFFATTSFMALLMHRRERGVVVEKYTTRRRSHDSRYETLQVH